MKTKRTAFAFILMTVLTVTAYAPKAHAQQYAPESDFWAVREGNGITINKYKGSRTAVYIPPSIQNLPVTGIGNYAFCDCTSLTGVTIPDSVTSIGDRFSDSGVFYNCKNLTSVTFKSTIPSSGFNSHDNDHELIGDLRDKFYAANKTHGTPGTYTRASRTSDIWTMR